MNAQTPLAPASAKALPARPVFGQAQGNAVSMRWAALQDAGKALALLAGVDFGVNHPLTRHFPALFREADQHRRMIAERSIEDLMAMMEPGLAALLAVSARGADARVPALVLWREYCAAREALLALLPEVGAMGPRRSA